MACLAKDPSDRPQSAEALAALLDAAALDTWTAEDSASWWAEHEPT